MAPSNNNVTASLRLLGQQKFSQGTKKADKDIGRIGHAFKGAGAAGSTAMAGVFKKVPAQAAVAAAAAGVVFAGIVATAKEAITQDFGRDKLAAQLGLNPGRAKAYGKVAGRVYAGAWGDSLESVNDAIRNVSFNIAGSADTHTNGLEQMTTRALDFNTVFGTETADTTKAVGQLMRTGLVKNSEEAFDVLAAGFQHGADKAGDFLDTLNEYGTQFRKLGVDGKTATGIVAQGLRDGARDGDLVADALKEFSIRAVDGSTTSAAGYKALGLSAKAMTEQIAQGGKGASGGLQTVLDRLRGVKDPVKQAAAATALFGTQSEDLGKALFALDPSTAVKSLGQVDGAAQKMSTTINDNAATNITSFTRQVKQAAVNVIGGKLLPVIEDVSREMSTRFGPAFERAKPYIKTAAREGRHLFNIFSSNALPMVREGIDSLSDSLERNSPWLKDLGTQLRTGIVEYGPKVAEVFGVIAGGNFEALTTSLGYALDGVKYLGIGMVDMSKVILNVFGTVLHAATKAFGWVPDIGPKLKKADKAFGDFSTSANEKLDGIRTSLTFKADTSEVLGKIAEVKTKAGPIFSAFAPTSPVPAGIANPVRVRAGRRAAAAATAPAPRSLTLNSYVVLDGKVAGKSTRRDAARVAVRR